MDGEGGWAELKVDGPATAFVCSPFMTAMRVEGRLGWSSMVTE